MRTPDLRKLITNEVLEGRTSDEVADAILEKLLDNKINVEATEIMAGYEQAGWIVVALPGDFAHQIMGLPATQQNAFAFMGNLKAKISQLEAGVPAYSEDEINAAADILRPNPFPFDLGIQEIIRQVLEALALARKT